MKNIIKDISTLDVIEINYSYDIYRMCVEWISKTRKKNKKTRKAEKQLLDLEYITQNLT